MLKQTNPPSWFTKIKVFVWDLDGTLYKDIDNIGQKIKEKAIGKIARVKKITYTQAEVLHRRLYRKMASNTLVMLACGVDRDYILSGEYYWSTQLKVLQKDPRLPVLFDRLSAYRHLLNTNTASPFTMIKLEKLGLASNVFEKIWSNPDMLGKLKPEPEPFQAVLDYTGLPASQHLFVGDRVETDLVPAKKLGMRTCLVWGKSDKVDLSCQSVYELGKIWG